MPVSLEPEWRTELPPICQFVERLWNESRAEVPGRFARDAEDLQQAWLRLERFAAMERPALAGDPPAPSRASGTWALQSLFRSCYFLIHREDGPDEMVRHLITPCPEPLSPSVAYGVDLSFRFLPDLLRIARAASPGDRLVEALEQWCREWPLSSVGVEFTSPEASTGASDGDSCDRLAWLDDHSLRALYVDRILSRHDVSRLSDSRVALAVAAALGHHRELAPEMARVADAVLAAQGKSSLETSV